MNGKVGVAGGVENSESEPTLGDPVTFPTLETAPEPALALAVTNPFKPNAADTDCVGVGICDGIMVGDCVD
jgi:hypothetical protein